MSDSPAQRQCLLPENSRLSAWPSSHCIDSAIFQSHNASAIAEDKSPGMSKPGMSKAFDLAQYALSMQSHTGHDAWPASRLASINRNKPRETKSFGVSALPDGEIRHDVIAQTEYLWSTSVKSLLGRSVPSDFRFTLPKG